MSKKRKKNSYRPDGFGHDCKPGYFTAEVIDALDCSDSVTFHMLKEMLKGAAPYALDDTACELIHHTDVLGGSFRHVPFGNMTLEYVNDGVRSLVHVVRIPDVSMLGPDVLPATKEILLGATAISCVYASAPDFRWLVVPVSWVFPDKCSKPFSSGERVYFSDTPSPDRPFCISLDDKAGKIPQEALQELTSMEITFLLKFLAVVSCSNAPVVTLPAPRLRNKLRKDSYKIPAYRYLKLSPRRVSGASQGGTHASPRAHWRRGHVREQACGTNWQDRKTIWVRPMLIGSGPVETPKTKVIA